MCDLEDAKPSESVWEDVEQKIKKKNTLLFTRESRCLQELRYLVATQKHVALVLWVFRCMEETLTSFSKEGREKQAALFACEESDAWSRGIIKMPQAKRAILECHAAAKKADSAHEAALCHAIGQGCSVIHAETHALGLVFYELTALVIKNQYQNYQDEVACKIAYYIRQLLFVQENLSWLEGSRGWAEFLVRSGKMNKEKLLLEKESMGST